MKKDNYISFTVVIIVASLIFLVTRDFFLDFAYEYKIIGGFTKFFVLASIGDFIGLRIRSKKWQVPKGIFFKAIIWGLIGVSIVLMFTIYPIGVEELQKNNILPFYGNEFFSALFISILLNFTFAPTMMTFHRISDTYIEKRLQGKTTIKEAISSINFPQFINFTVFKTIPLFWIPAHTITFMLSPEYRVIFAAVLGIFLGLLLGLFNNRK